jgi:hypothetical protein
MTTATTFQDADRIGGAQPQDIAGTRFLAWILAAGPAERQLITTDPHVRAQFGFQAAALIGSPIWFGVTVGNVAANLFEYPWLGALGLALVSMIGVFILDWNFLVQRRGTPENAQGGVNKVRFATLVVLTISAALMATHSFQRDIDGVLSKERAARRAELEQSPRYRLELEAARDNMVRGEAAAKRAEELSVTIGELEVQQAVAEEGNRNECEGNTTGNHVRIAKCGTIARGFDAEARRLGQEIETTKQQFARTQTLASQLPAARQRLAEIETGINDDPALARGGPLKSLEVLCSLIAGGSVAFVLVIFWMAVGVIFDLPIWFAQGKSFNHELLLQARDLENQMHKARIGQLRSEWRRNHSATMAPLEVRLAKKPVSAHTNGREPVMKDVESGVES